MSEDLRSLNIYPAFYNFTAGDSTTTEILLPSPATQISLGATGKEIFVCRNGATDGGAIPSNKMTVPSEQLHRAQTRTRKEQARVDLCCIEVGQCRDLCRT